MTIYEMTEQAAALYEMLSNEEIDQQTFDDTLEAIGTSEKIDSYCIVINQLEGDKALMCAEINRLGDRVDRCERAVERMKNALDAFMQAKGSEKEKTDKFTVSYRKSERVQITDEHSIPSEYIKTKVTETTSIDKIAIKQAIKSGKTVQGAFLAECQNLQIK